MNRLPLRYPLRTVVAFATILGILVVVVTLPVSAVLAWGAAMLIGAVALWLIVWRSYQIARITAQSSGVIAALGSMSIDLPVRMRARMPVVMVIGDELDRIFDRTGVPGQLVHIGNGAIWLRVGNIKDLRSHALAVRAWRDGRAPDCVVFALAPALHVDESALAQYLRLIRQNISDTASVLGTTLPSYLAVYQRLTSQQFRSGDLPQWYGLSSTHPLTESVSFEPVIQAAEDQPRGPAGQTDVAWRTAGVTALIKWTEKTILGALGDRRYGAPSWRVLGSAWIDVGPASGPASVWAKHIEARTTLTAPPLDAFPDPWPFPEALLSAMPRASWASPRMVAIAHVLCVSAMAAAVAFWGVTQNNRSLLALIGNDLARFHSIPAANDAAKRDALETLKADRDQIDRYHRVGVPLNLSFGLYHGVALLPVLNAAIVAYQPPANIVSLNSMSLFDEGSAALKANATRALVSTLDIIKNNPDKRIIIAGYTDISGNDNSNQILSLSRASAVRDWLVDASNVPVTRFAVQGYGDTRPIADNATADGRARNRRVEITLVPESPGT